MPSTDQKKADGRGGRAPTVGIMLRQEELAFIKAITNIELSPVFLQELRKAVAAGKKKALGASKPCTSSASATNAPKELAVSLGLPATLRSCT